jgi:hypothetical protein
MSPAEPTRSSESSARKQGLHFLVDIKLALGNNPPLFTVFSLGISMSITSSVFSILVLSGDPDIQSQFKDRFKDASVTVAKYAATPPKRRGES